jgi:hypothetical protein
MRNRSAIVLRSFRNRFAINRCAIALQSKSNSATDAQLLFNRSVIDLRLLWDRFESFTLSLHNSCASSLQSLLKRLAIAA